MQLSHVTTTTTLFAVHAEARRIVDILNQEDKEWTYVVGTHASGQFMVLVYDEHGLLLGAL